MSQHAVATIIQEGNKGIAWDAIFHMPLCFFDFHATGTEDNMNPFTCCKAASVIFPMVMTSPGPAISPTLDESVLAAEDVLCRHHWEHSDQLRVWCRNRTTADHKLPQRVVERLKDTICRTYTPAESTGESAGPPGTPPNTNNYNYRSTRPFHWTSVLVPGREPDQLIEKVCCKIDVMPPFSGGWYWIF